MTTDLFHWEGFFRSLQGSITSIIGFSILIFAILLVVRWFIRKSNASSEVKDMERVANRIAFGLICLTMAVFIWHAISVASINRMPRQDTDTSGVYKEMKSHINQ